ncbi:unnamed protein product, partial [Notodromas monacha]
HELRAFRDVKHQNVLKLLGRCLEADPFLALLEYCPTGDLKTYLRSLRGTAGEDGLKRDGVLIRMAQEIASALHAIHNQNIVHLDLAVRNCLLTENLTVKIGDYGDCRDRYPEDYFPTENGYVPVRWVAPECIESSLGSLKIKPLTSQANVWTYGVVTWEILEMGAQPYGELVSDRDIVTRVLLQRSYKLRLPTGNIPLKDKIYDLMVMCWEDENFRPSMAVVEKRMSELLRLLQTGECPQTQDQFSSNVRTRTMSEMNGYDMHPSLCFESDFNFVAMKDPVIWKSPTYEQQCVLEAVPTDWFGDQTVPASVNFKLGENYDSIVSHVPFTQPTLSVVVDDSLLMNSQQFSNNSDDDEGWKSRVESGYLAMKIREKSKSVQNLMKLTHLECSPDPEITETRSNLSSLNLCASESDLRVTVAEQSFLEDIKLQSELMTQSTSFAKKPSDFNCLDSYSETFSGPSSADMAACLSSTPREPLETKSADLAKFQPEVFNADVSDVIIGPSDDLGLDYFQALKSSSTGSATVKRALFNLDNATKRVNGEVGSSEKVAEQETMDSVMDTFARLERAAGSLDRQPRPYKDRRSIESNGSWVVINTPVKNVELLYSECDETTSSISTLASNAYVTASESTINEAYFTADSTVDHSDQSTLMQKFLQSDDSGVPDAEISPEHALNETFVVKDRKSIESNGSWDMINSPDRRTFSSPKQDESNDFSRCDQASAGDEMHSSDENDADESSDENGRDRADVADSLKRLRDMLGAQLNNISPEKNENEDEVQQIEGEKDEYLINAENLSSGLPLVLSPIRELSEDGDSADSATDDFSEEESDDENLRGVKPVSVNGLGHNGSIILEDLDSPNLIIAPSEPFNLRRNANDDSDVDDCDETDDILVVDTETNEAFLCEGGKPCAHVAFMNKKTADAAEVIAETMNSFMFDEEDTESEPLFRINDHISSSWFAASQHASGLQSLPPAFVSAQNSVEASPNSGMGPTSLPWGGDKPDSFTDERDVWGGVRTGSVSTALESKNSDLVNEFVENSVTSCSASPRELPLPDCSGDLRNHEANIQPQWNDLVKEAANQGQEKFGSLKTVDEDLHHFDGDHLLGERETPDGLQLKASDAPEPDAVCYTPDFESETTESSSDESDDSSSTTSGEYVYTRETDEIKVDGIKATPNDGEKIISQTPEDKPRKDDSSDEREDGSEPSEPFKPSIWNRDLLPARSLLKKAAVQNPDKRESSPESRKSVKFSAQECSEIYEYPYCADHKCSPMHLEHNKHSYSGDWSPKMLSLSSTSAPVNVAEWDAEDDDEIPEELASGPFSWPAVGNSNFQFDAEEIYPTPSRLSAIGHFSFSPERCEGDGSFSGSEFFPGKFAPVEFFNDDEERDDKLLHSRDSEESRYSGQVLVDHLISSRDANGSFTKFDLRPDPLGAEADASPEENVAENIDTFQKSDEGISCDKISSNDPPLLT